MVSPPRWRRRASGWIDGEEACLAAEIAAAGEQASVGLVYPNMAILS